MENGEWRIDNEQPKIKECTSRYQLPASNSPLVKKGYKQTEVGVIPEDWMVYSIQQISRTGSGTTPARFHGDKYYRDGIINWVKTTDLNNSVINHTDEKITSIALNETCLKIYPKDTILVAMYGGFNQIGRTGMLNIPACVNQALVAIQVNPIKTEPRFLLDILNYKVNYWRLVASSSRKDPNITSKDVKEFKLGVPSDVEEQKAIAKALSDVDALIEAQEKLIARKQAIKTATMQQLLTGKIRLRLMENGKWIVDNENKHRTKQTELGEIPEDWEAEKLEELAEIDCDNLSAMTSSDYTFKYISLEDVNKGQLEKFSQIEFSCAPSRARRILKYKDILFSTVRPNLLSHLLFQYFGHY